VIPDEWGQASRRLSLGLTDRKRSRTCLLPTGRCYPRTAAARRKRGESLAYEFRSDQLSFSPGRPAKADFPPSTRTGQSGLCSFMPSRFTSTGDSFLAHVHSDFYEKARKYVENGGFLYASVASDGAIPEMASLRSGARLVDRAVARRSH